MVEPLDPAKLCNRCEAERLDIESTADLEPLPQFVGQDRALEALRFAVDIDRQGYNAFALGPPGFGKRRAVLRLLRRHAAGGPVPSDWCYVERFDDPRAPRALRLPPGSGRLLRDEMRDFVERLRTLLPEAFEGEAYKARLRSLEREYEEVTEEALSSVRTHAQERNLMLVTTPTGLLVAPARDGEVIPPDEFNNLPEDERARWKEDMDSVSEELRGVIGSQPGLQRKHFEKVAELHREVARATLDEHMRKLKQRFAELPEVKEHIDAVEDDIVKHVGELLHGKEGKATQQPLPAILRNVLSDGLSFDRYEVNLLVDHMDAEDAPVVFEGRPTHDRLLGRVEYRAQLGAMMTNFRYIRSGALHEANGGYLVLEAAKVLTRPFAWEALKRALREQEIVIEPLTEELSLSQPYTLRPDPIPLDVKVVLTGDRMLYYLLAEVDPDLADLFKVAADFDDDVERDPDSELLYARGIATLVESDELLHLDRGAIARVIEHSTRRAGDSGKLSASTRRLSDLLREADHLARAAERERVTAADVQAAIDAQRRRFGRLRERVLEQVHKGVVMIDTAGEHVGQVNGLAVSRVGDSEFGHPVRITARTRLGKGEIVDIERRSELGQPIHSKGVMILGAYLASRFVPETPLSLWASLVFEQSYGPIEGDSASAAELFALLSSLSETPLRQDLAVTGSVNQHGRIQPIGGVNHKIEGFFDVCKERGLSGTQGVIVPDTNVRHLMLRSDVVEACRDGKFAVYPIATIDEGLALFTGKPADEVNAAVEEQLLRYAEVVKTFGKDKDDKPAGAQKPQPV